MNFSSIPAYLDPSNWQQQAQNPQAGDDSGGSSSQLPPPPLPPPSHGGGPGSIRPGSMADRARMANIPMPEVALKCPRCDSTNTKFCYFNNYSLTQPRHFCKTCRRYWTRGGALRSVPVGGGCRRNKRSKGGGSSSKSPVSGDRQTSSGGNSSSAISSNSTGTTSILGLTPPIPPLRFISPLSQLTEFGSADMGLNYMSGISATGDMNFHLGSSSFLGGGIPGISPLAGLDLSSGLYPFQVGGGGGFDPSGGEGGHQFRPRVSAPGVMTQLAPVKMEENKELNLPRQFLGIEGNNDQFWSGTTAWTDLSGFSSSSTSNPL